MPAAGSTVIWYYGDRESGESHKRIAIGDIRRILGRAVRSGDEDSFCPRE
jgi:hypothetical protein